MNLTTEQGGLSAVGATGLTPATELAALAGGPAGDRHVHADGSAHQEDEQSGGDAIVAESEVDANAGSDPVSSGTPTAATCAAQSLQFEAGACVAQCTDARATREGENTCLSQAVRDCNLQTNFINGEACVASCPTDRPAPAGSRECAAAGAAASASSENDDGALRVDSSPGTRQFVSCEWVDDLPRRVHTIQRACGAGRNKAVCVGFVVCRKQGEAETAPKFIRSSTCSADNCRDGDALACTREPGFFSASASDLEGDAAAPSESVRRFLSTPAANRR